MHLTIFRNRKRADMDAAAYAADAERMVSRPSARFGSCIWFIPTMPARNGCNTVAVPLALAVSNASSR